MKAEIGFVWGPDYVATDRMKLVVTPQSDTESTLLSAFARRVGLTVATIVADGIGTLVIEEPAK